MSAPLILLVAVACSCSQHDGGTLKSNAQGPTTTSSAKLAPPAGKSVRIVPVAGAPTRAELQEEMLGASFVEPAQFLRTLDAANQAVQDFAAYEEIPAEPKMLLAHFSNHDVRNRDLRELVARTMKATESMSGWSSPQTHTASDALTYPRVLVLWQSPHAYKLLRINLNNDNKAVYFFVGRGTFSAKAYGPENFKRIPTGQQVLQAASFLDDTRTIWPHIEEYYVCPSECEHLGVK